MVRISVYDIALGSAKDMKSFCSKLNKPNGKYFCDLHRPLPGSVTSTHQELFDVIVELSFFIIINSWWVQHNLCITNNAKNIHVQTECEIFLEEEINF